MSSQQPSHYGTPRWVDLSSATARVQIAGRLNRGAVQPRLVPLIRLRYSRTIVRCTGERMNRMRSSSLRHIETDPERSRVGSLQSHSPIAPSGRGQERRSLRPVRQAPGACRGA